MALRARRRKLGAFCFVRSRCVLVALFGATRLMWALRLLRPVNSAAAFAPRAAQSRSLLSEPQPRRSWVSNNSASRCIITTSGWLNRGLNCSRGRGEGSIAQVWRCGIDFVWGVGNVGFGSRLYLHSFKVLYGARFALRSGFLIPFNSLRTIRRDAFS